MQYELLYLIGERNEADLETIKASIDQMLTEEGATLGEEMIMKKKLAYEIKHERRGTYVARRFELPEYDMWANESEADQEKGVSNLTRKLNLKAEILRSIIVKTDDIPDLASLEAAQQQQKQQQQRKQGDRKQDDRRAPRRQPRQEAPAAAKPEIKAEEKEEVKVEEKKAESIAAQRETEEKEKTEEKSIDKQLEEILNI